MNAPFISVEQGLCRELFREANGVYLPVPKNLAPNTKKLVRDFAEVLAEKLHANELKHHFSDNWLHDLGQDKCSADLQAHLIKGDPRDVAIYCAFMWAQGWSCSPKERDR